MTAMQAIRYKRGDTELVDLLPLGTTHTVADALALADAIYSALGKLPRVEDVAGASFLHLMYLRGGTISSADLRGDYDFDDDFGFEAARKTAKRLHAMGLIGGNDTHDRYALYALTDKGREFVAAMDRQEPMP